MDHDDTTTLNLDAYGAQLDALLDAMAATAVPSSAQEALARRARELAVAIVASATAGDAEAAGDWEGSRAGAFVSAMGTAGGLVIALRGMDVAWIQGSRPDGVTWQIDYGPALSEGVTEGDAPSLRVRISRDLEVLSDLAFLPTGVVRDERDWAGKISGAWRELADEAQSVDLPDDDGGGALGRAGAGRPKLPPVDGGASGGGGLRGAAAGMAAAAAGLARGAGDAARSPGSGEAQGRRCHHCGNENPVSGVFCSHCGARLERDEGAAPPQEQAPQPPTHCARCGRPLPPGGRFCTGCGAPVMSAPPSAATPGAGRTCVACGAPLAPGARFCAACGAHQGVTSGAGQSRRCRHCGHELPSGVRFCPHCGLPADEANAGRPARP